VFHIRALQVDPGTLSVQGSQVKYSGIGNEADNFTLSCSDFTAHAKNDGRDTSPSMFTSQWQSGITVHVGRRKLYLENPIGVAGGVTYEKVLAACAAAPAAAEAAKRRAVAAEERAKEEKAVAEQAAIREQAAARDREAAAVKREVDFRNGILVALHAAEEPDPFASIRGDFDLSGSDSRHWKTSLQLSGAEKCALLKTAAATPTAASAWTFGCLFRASSDGYERMVKTVQSVLNLPFQPDEKALNMNQVFFADSSKPAWRFFAAKMKDGTVGLSVVAVRFADAPATAVNTTPFPAVPTMLPTDPAFGGEGVRAGQAIPTGASDAQCQEYQRQELERISKEQEVRRLGAELQSLQLQYQDASTKALQAQQSANNSGQTQTGVLGALNSTMGAIATTVAQQKQAEAQNLQTQITFKQSQLTNAQISLSTLTRTAPPPGGCAARETAPRSVAASRTGAVPNVLPAGLTIHEEVEKIRSGNHAPMPPAQRSALSATGAIGRTTMTVRNPTAYELSVFFDGPVAKKLVLAPGASQDVDLVAGAFHVAGRVAAADVLPFYGDDTYAGSTGYSITFYIAP